VLVVRAVYLGVDVSLVSYQLELERLGCLSPEEAAQASLEGAVAEGERSLQGVHVFRNQAGDEGAEYVTLDEAGSLAARLSPKMQAVVEDQGFVLSARRIFLGIAPGECVKLSLVSVYDLDEPEVEYMLSSFEPRPAGEGT